MSDTVLVTGAGGFVGSAVVRCLVARLASGEIRLPSGRTVSRVVGVLTPGQGRERLSELSSAANWGLKAVDLRRPDQAEALVRAVRPAAVVHAALDAAVFVSATREEAEQRAAVPLEALVRGLAASDGARFVHTGSAWVLPAGAALDERTPPAPTSTYAFAKAREDVLLPQLASGLPIEWSILRLFNLIGRHERPDRLIPYLVRQLTNGGVAELSQAQNIRDFTDVDVVATSFVRALEAPAGADTLFHIGTGRGTSVGRVAQIVSEHLGRPDLVRFGARPTPDDSVDVQVADVALARTQLGWSAAGETEAWVRDAADWWLARGTTVSASGANRGGDS